MKRSRGLSDDERKLLAHAMRDVKPFRPSHSIESSLDDKKPQESSLKATASQKKTQQIKRGATPSQVHLDQKTRQKLMRGRIRIDARLDLHGMRQEEAYHRLVRFVASSVSRGDRTILVITGKGRGQVDDEDGRYVIPEGRGVLRLNVPRWLAEPTMRAHVWSVAEAGPQHGGSGAYYVLLRRRKE